MIINREININKELIILILIILTPILFFTYSLIPEKTSVNVFGNIIEAGYFEYIDTLVWSLVSQIIVIVLISLWFVTCKHWWRYLLLTIIILYIKNLTIIPYDRIYEDVNYLIVFLVALFYISCILYVSKRLKYYSFSKSINQQIDEEINILMEKVSNYKKEDYKEFKHKLNLLRKQKPNLDKRDYLIKLIKLREDFALSPGIK